MAGPPTSPVNLSSASDTETPAPTANAAAAAADNDDDVNDEDTGVGETCCCDSCNERRCVFIFRFRASFASQKYILSTLILCLRRFCICHLLVAC